MEKAEVDALADLFKDYQTKLQPFFLVLTGYTKGNKVRKCFKRATHKLCVKRHDLRLGKETSIFNSMAQTYQMAVFKMPAMCPCMP